VLDACARVRKDIKTPGDFIEAVRAGNINIADFTGHVLGQIKERFAERRLRSIADTLNKLMRSNHRDRMYDLAGEYFLDRTCVVEHLQGKDFTWQVVPQQGMSETVDFRLAAMPRGATSIDNALLIVPHEQKATNSKQLGKEAPVYVEQMLQQFVREIGQLRKIEYDKKGRLMYKWEARTSHEMIKRVAKQFVRFWDIIPDEGMVDAEHILAAKTGFVKLKKYLQELKESPSAVDRALYNEIRFPSGMEKMIERIMNYGPKTINVYDHPTMHIATVSNVQVTYEKTNPSSEQHAWVVRFKLTPAKPAGSAAIPVRLIVGWHQTISTRAEYEQCIHNIFRKWLDDAGVPYPPGL